MTTKKRLTDAEFDELKRKRDAGVEAALAEICAEYGWDRSKMHVHCSHSDGCYCGCPDGPCQHVWDGPWVEFDNGGSVTCSRCGTTNMSHAMRTGP